MKKLGIISILLYLTACATEPCEEESFGYIEFDNATLHDVSIRVTVTDIYELEEVLPYTITIDAGHKSKVMIPQGMIEIECEPDGSDSLGLLNSCETIIHVIDFIIYEECGTCELVTVDSNGNESTGTPLPFCGDAFVEKQNSNPVTVGDFTTYWNCY